jgi:hypothetical protein
VVMAQRRSLIVVMITSQPAVLSTETTMGRFDDQCVAVLLIMSGSIDSESIDSKMADLSKRDRAITLSNEAGREKCILHQMWILILVKTGNPECD